MLTPTPNRIEINNHAEGKRNFEGLGDIVPGKVLEITQAMADLVE
jgi:hypothetical protein